MNNSQDFSDKFSSTDLFDLSTFAHKSIFSTSNYAWDALKELEDYIHQWITDNKVANLGSVSKGAYLKNPSAIFIGEGSVIEPGAYVAGPTIIGRNCHIRHGAYIRGQVILGDNVIVGHATEVKTAIFLNNAKAPHFAYVGDSILGNHVNLGAGTKLSNMPMNSKKDPITKKRPIIKIQHDGNTYDTGLAKLGAILGDHVQTGCNCVLNPGCIIGQGSMVYASVSLRKGYFPANIVVKLRQNIQKVDWDPNR